MAFKPVKFYKEVKSEMGKVTWPTRKETTLSTIMVFFFVFLTAIFLFIADEVIYNVLWKLILDM